MTLGRHRATIGLILAGQSTQALALSGIALFLPLIRREIGMTFTQAGGLAVASTVVYALMQVPAGYLADRYGAKLIFLAGVSGTCFTSFMLSVLNTYELLLVNQAAAGLCWSLVFAPGLVLIASHFAPERRATAMGLYLAGGLAFTVLLNATAPALVGPSGWRAVFAVVATVGAATVVAHWRLGDPGPAAKSHAQRPRLRDVAKLLRHRVMWLSGIVQFVRLAVVNAIRFWLPTYLVVDKGFSLQVAGLIVALGAAMSAPSGFLGGYLSDRLQRPLLVIGGALTALAASCVLIVEAESLPMIAAIVAIQSLFVQLYFGPLFEFPMRHLPDSGSGAVSGLSNLCANLGGLTFAYTLGAVKDATGSFSAGFYSLAALCMVGLGTTWLMSKLEPKAPAVA